MKVVTVRKRDQPARSRLERVLLTAPEAFRWLIQPVFWLPAGSRLRTAVIKMTLERSYAALNRGDTDLIAILFYHPDVALNFANDVGPDYETRYEGRDLLFAAYRRWLDDWGVVRRDPAGFVDRGETVVVLGREFVRGESSGLEVERELAQVFRLRGAGVAEQTEFYSWDEALAH